MERWSVPTGIARAPIDRSSSITWSGRPICSHGGVKLAVMAVLIPRSTLAGAIGNTVEWFDFAVYGSLVREIGEAFFPALRWAI